jgi:hypothetical protein
MYNVIGTKNIVRRNMTEEICENNNTHKPLVSGPNPLVVTIPFLTANQKSSQQGNTQNPHTYLLSTSEQGLT